MPKKIKLSKRMFNYVTICRFSRRGLLCLACLLATKVVADYGASDRSILEGIKTDTGDMAFSIDDVADMLMAEGGYTTIDFGDDYHFASTDFATCYNILKTQLALNQYYTYSTPSDFSTRREVVTLLGLIRGFNMSPQYVNDGIPVGANTNGIWYFTKDLSDALHNTNSVFHRQLTAQETLTNQMERFLAHTSNYLERISYQLSYPYGNVVDQYFLLPDEFNTSKLTNSVALLGSNFGGFDFTLLDWDEILTNWRYPYSDYYSQLELIEFATTLEDFSRMRYDRYGTKWGFDSITNILLSQDFDFNSISVVKPEVDDMIQDSTDEVQDSLPNTSEELESVPPGDYEEVQDDRIDTSFLDEAKTDVTSIKFSEHLFDDFKNSYNGIFNFRSSSSLQYSFALQSSVGVNVSVNDTDMLANASHLLAEKKPTIDSLIKIIIGLNKFICLVVLVGKAFKMVSEIFSS